jgi:hypothetical protein
MGRGSRGAKRHLVKVSAIEQTAAMLTGTFLRILGSLERNLKE